MEKLRRRIAVLVGMIGIFGSTIAVSPAQANSITMSGVYVTAICPYGYEPQGMWYSAPGGYQGWARWVRAGQYSEQFGMGLPLYSTVHLAIGCGGNRSSWSQTYYADIFINRSPTAYYGAYCYQSSGSTCPAG